jgi:predicted MFS family arabinose efflux permease
MEIGVGILVICNLSIAGTLYAQNKTSSLLKINYGNTIALFIAPLLVSLILYIGIGWRYYYILHPLIVIGLSLILWRMDVPAHIKVETNMKKLFSASRSILTDPVFILCGVIIFFYVSIMSTFYVWFTSYFTGINIDLDISSIFLSIYGIAIFLGMILRNKLIRYFKEKRILFYSFCISILMMTGILLVNNLLAKIIFIFMFGTSVAGNFSITFSISSGLFPKYTNSASGITVAFANLGAMVFQYVTGYMSEHFSRNSILYINISILLVLIVLTALLNFHRKFQR